VVTEELLFQGLKVLDLGSWIAAPSCAAMFADLGAEVIKIEQPEVGDAYRSYYLLPRSPNADANYTWTLDNRNKRSLSLNLKAVAGRAILETLIRQCDVYITNQPLPMRRELGLMWEDLQPLNERMIYASLTAYGEEGPERDKEAFDLVAYWSRSGLMNQMRHDDVQPRQAMAGMGDHPTGVALYASIVTALLKRERTGRGAKVHTSLLANGLWSASCLAQAVWADADFSHIPGQSGMTALFQAADGRWIQFSMIRTVEDFDRLVMALGKLEWLTDDRFATPESRADNTVLFTQMLRELIVQRASHEWMSLFQAENIPAALVAQFEDLPNDPQVLLNSMATEPAEELGMPRVVRDPVNVDGVARVGATHAPDVGEHTDEILSDLGFTDAQVVQLRNEGVV